MHEDERPRVLVLGGRSTGHLPVPEKLAELFRVDVCEGMDEAMGALRREAYHAVFADVGDFLPLERGLVGQKASMVLNTIGEGVCIVDADGTCNWSNNRMQSFSPEVFERVRQVCMQAWSGLTQGGGEPALEQGGQPRSRKYALDADDGRYYEVMTSPLVGDDGRVRQVVAVAWDATSGRRLQQKIDAIDSAGGELAQIDCDAVAKQAPGQRLNLIKDQVIRYSRDLMHFDHFNIRVLDKVTKKLELVISEGLLPEAMELDLYAQPEGNGISGYVAATGRSYICHDTEKDPRYVIGIDHCKSSLTVPLRLHKKVVGVFNIESDSVGSFNEDDRQFAEIFGRHIAHALNILDLLVVERCTVTGRLTDSVVQEMAQPLNDIVTEAQTLMEEYIGDDTMRGRLNKITDYVGSIRQSLREVAAGPNAVLGIERVTGETDDPVLKGKRFLIADDDLNIRKTIGDILTKHGGKCSLCRDGHEAIVLLEQKEFDLVISDIKMPHRNGYDIFAAARRQREDIPVVLMTGFGYDPNHSIVRATEEGLSSVLFKPFKVEQFLAGVRGALTGTSGESDESEAPEGGSASSQTRAEG